MAQYYRNRPSAVPLNVPTNSTSPATTPTEGHHLTEFDRHRESLLSDDLEEGWASELRRYLNIMQRDVK